MNSPSDEQQYAIDEIKNGKNLTVNAVAGSGKTTLVLCLAVQVTGVILQLTYNTNLKNDNERKIHELNLENIRVNTFHGLAKKYYLKTEFVTDTELRKILREDMKPLKPIYPVDILVLDEVQDMTPLYFQFVVKFLRDMGSKVQILVLGDVSQCLYEFKGADSRYLSMADKIWDGFAFLKTNEFSNRTLRTTYRITNQMASFVNEVMLGENRMVACKDGEPVIYSCNTKSWNEKSIVAKVKNLLNECGYLPEDIFILCSSLKGKIIHNIENALVQAGIPCHIPLFEQDKINDNVIEGKVVFSTFHSVKGRQRKCVFVIRFDQSYFNNIAKDLDPKVCPNTLYVANTRATERLFLYEYNDYKTDRQLDFLKLKHYEMEKKDYIKLIGKKLCYDFEDCKQNERKSNGYIFESPTHMLRFLDNDFLEFATEIIERNGKEENLQEIEKENEEKPVCLVDLTENETQEKASIPMVIKTDTGYEDVSDINGIVIPIIIYNRVYNFRYGENPPVNILYHNIKTMEQSLPLGSHDFLRTLISKLSPSYTDSIETQLYMGNILVALNNTLYYRLKQIQNYDWISEEVMKICEDNLMNNIGEEFRTIDEPIWEYTFVESRHEIYNNEKYYEERYENERIHRKIDEKLKPHLPNKVRFTSRVDLVTDYTVWELKCTSEITIEHKLQVIIYAWLWEMLEEPKKDFKILNIKTGEVWVLQLSMEEIESIVIELLKSKYIRNSTLTDEEFIEKNRLVTV